MTVQQWDSLKIGDTVTGIKTKREYRILGKDLREYRSKYGPTYSYLSIDGRGYCILLTPSFYELKIEDLVCI